MAFIKYEVGKPFPGPVPTKEGAHLELWEGGWTLLVQFPKASKAELKAFTSGPSGYSYLEPTLEVPLAIWVFDFPRPFNMIDVSFDSKLVREELIQSALDTTDGVKNLISIYVVDGQKLAAMKSLWVKPKAMELFLATIQKQRQASYSAGEFAHALNTMFAFSTQELMKMGTYFDHKKV